MSDTPSAAWIACVSLLALTLGGACAKTRPADPVQPARVRFENRTDLTWKITLLAGPGPTAEASRADQALRLAPREIRVCEVGAGSYRVRVLPEDTQASLDTWALPPEGETVRLVAGRSYVWPLATLLSDGEAER